MRRWLKREKADLIELAIAFGTVVLLAVLSMVLFGGAGAGAGAAGAGAGAGVSMAARRGARETSEPRGRLTVVGMRQAAVVVWAALLAALVLVVAIQHRHEDPLAFAVVLAGIAALLAWAVAWLASGRRRGGPR